MSLGYCGFGRRSNLGDGSSAEMYWPKSAFGNQLTCLALCEIVDKKDDFTTYPGIDTQHSSSLRPNNDSYGPLTNGLLH